jgi:hypothetical protein
MPRGATAAGTLDPPDEVETFRFECPRDASLYVSAVGRSSKAHRRPPALAMRVFDPEGVEIAGTRSRGVRAWLKGAPAPSSGVHRIEVSSADGLPGDYRLTVNWTARPRSSAVGDASAGPTSISFAFDAGAAVSLDVARSRGSSSLPRLERLVRKAGGYDVEFDPPADAAARRHRAKVVVPLAGEYDLIVSDAGGGGAFAAVATARAPRRVVVAPDLRAAPTSGDSDAGTFGAVVGAAGGEVAVAAPGASPIDGASVTIQPGAVLSPASIVISTSKPFAASDSSLRGAGPAVFFGPEGLAFSTPVQVTVPFDASRLGADGLAALRVYTRDASGAASLVPPPYSIDAARGLVSFAVSHFSSFAAFGTAKSLPADLDGDGYEDLAVRAPGGYLDKGAVFVFKGRPGFDADSSSDADVVLIGDVEGDAFGNDVATGDVDGDGTADLVVTAPGADGGAGKAFVFRGGTGLASGDAGARADFVLTPRAGDHYLGDCALVADVTGDGTADVIVGDSLSDVPAAAAGQVYVFPGGSGFASRAADASDVIVVSGAAAGDGVGVSLAAGDLDGDGKTDLVVGGPHFGSSGTGRVDVLLGAGGIASQTVGTGSQVFTAASSDDGFGVLVAVGDLDGDGTDDLAVGAILVDDAGAGFTDAGRIYVFLGGPSFSGRSASAADRTIDFETENLGYLGTALRVADVVGDRTPDLLYSAGGVAGTSGPDAGSVQVLRGGPDFPAAHEIVYGVPGDFLGYLFAPVDLDGDGRVETSYATAQRSVGGVVQIVFGAGLVGRVATIFGASGDRLGGY